jgi:hypothetical protein
VQQYLQAYSRCTELAGEMGEPQGTVLDTPEHKTLEMHARGANSSHRLSMEMEPAN